MIGAERWVAFVERRHRLILVLSLLLALASALSLLRLRLDIDLLGMLPVGSPAFDNFKTFVADFGELDELWILIESPQASELPDFADAFVDRLRQLDSVVSIQGRIDPAEIVDGLLGRYRFNYIPAETYDRLATELTADGIEARVRGARQALQAPLDLSAAQWVRRDPLGFTRLAAQHIQAGLGDRRVNVAGGYLATEDGRALLVVVRPSRNPFDMPFTTRFMAQVRAAEAEVRRSVAGAGGVRVGYTGSYAFALEDAGTIKTDVVRYSILALAGVLAVFLVGYRNLRILPFVTYPLVLSTLLTFAAGVVAYDQLNAVSLSFAAILYGLSIDSGIHYYTRLLQEVEERPLRDAVRVTLQQLGGANVVASATTATAFFVIGYSQLVGISQLGALSGFGMLVNILQFFVLYPALSFAMSRRVLAGAPLDTPRLGRLAAAAARHARLVVLCVAILSAACAWVARRLEFDVDLTHLRPGQSEAGRVQDEVTRLFGGEATSGAVLVRAADTEAALQSNEAVSARLEAYRAEGLLRQFNSVAVLLPSERTQRERLARFDAMPRARIAADLRLSLQQHGFRTASFAGFLEDLERGATEVVQPGDAALAPFAGVIGRYLRQRAGAVTLAAYVQPATGVRLPDVTARLRNDLPGVDLIAASRQWLEDDLGRLLRRELVWFCAAAFLLNLLLVLPNFPRLSMAAAILIPEALVILAFLAMAVFRGMGIDPVNLIVVPLILGIGVDYCVYVAERVQHGAPMGEAVRLGGRALAVSAFSTMAGFGFLGLSRYPALARMGEYTAVSLFLCLVAAVVLLPALLVVFGAVKAERSS